MQRFIDVCIGSQRVVLTVPIAMQTYLNQRSDILILNSPLSRNLMKPPSIPAIPHALILKVTLATLVANGAVQWMIRQQKLHHALPRLVCERAVRLDHHSRLHRPRAGCHGLRRPLDLDQTHSAVSGDHEFLVVAVAGDGGTGLLAGLDEGGAGYVGYQHCVFQLEHYHCLPSIDTFFPSTVNSTSAFLCRVVEKALACCCCAALRRATLCDRRSDRHSCCRIILANQHEEWKGKRGEAKARVVAVASCRQDVRGGAVEMPLRLIDFRAPFIGWCSFMPEAS